MRKLVFFLAVWKRPEITEICFMGLDRLRKLGTFHVNLFAVISEESMIPLCEKYGVKWVMHENLPLGKKKNFGLSEALKEDFDYLVEIGSDDIFKNEFLNLYSWDRDLFTLADFVMLNTEGGECRRLSKHHARYGTGRAISREALLKMDGLWSGDLNKGLDNNSTFRLARKGILGMCVPSEVPLVIGLKSDVNIWPFESKGMEYPLEKALEGLSDQEVNAIRCLIQNKTLASLTEG